jgi:hypothetical protein
VKLSKESQSGTKISWDEFSTRTDTDGKFIEGLLSGEYEYNEFGGR